jgi:hypothetical protein
LGASPGRLAAVLFCALAVAAVGALAVIQKVKLEGVVLDLARVSRCIPATAAAPAACEQATGPAGREEKEVFVEFRMRSSSDDAVVRIVDSRDEPVATLLDGGSLVGDDRFYTFYWDGETDAGEEAPPGKYRAEILLRDQGREILPDESVSLPEEAG